MLGESAVLNSDTRNQPFIVTVSNDSQSLVSQRNPSYIPDTETPPHNNQTNRESAVYTIDASVHHDTAHERIYDTFDPDFFY
jgi:hypothetical protein